MVGQGLAEITQDPDVEQALFDVLETQRIIEGEAAITFVPAGRSDLLADLIAPQAERGRVAGSSSGAAAASSGAPATPSATLAVVGTPPPLRAPLPRKGT